jgi:hypothetical protein
VAVKLSSKATNATDYADECELKRAVLRCGLARGMLECAMLCCLRRSWRIRKDRPHTLDGRYFVAKGKLRRCTNPNLPDQQRRRLIKQLMQSRMAARNAETEVAIAEASQAVAAMKAALGESGAVWWGDGAPDYSGFDPVDTPYAIWWRGLSDEVRAEGC